MHVYPFHTKFFDEILGSNSGQEYSCGLEPNLTLSLFGNCCSCAEFHSDTRMLSIWELGVTQSSFSYYTAQLAKLSKSFSVMATEKATDSFVKKGETRK